MAVDPWMGSGTTGYGRFPDGILLDLMLLRNMSRRRIFPIAIAGGKIMAKGKRLITSIEHHFIEGLGDHVVT